MAAETWLLMFGIGLGTFAASARLFSGFFGRRSRGRRPERGEQSEQSEQPETDDGPEKRDEGEEHAEDERAALKAALRHHMLLSSSEFREQTREEIAALKRQWQEGEGASGNEQDRAEHIARREAELSAADDIIAERQRRLDDAIRIAGVAGDDAEAIRRAADVRSLLPLIADTLRLRVAQAEAVKAQKARAEEIRQQVVELEAETTRLQREEAEAANQQRAKAELMRRQMEEAEATRRQAAELEAEALRLQEARAKAMHRHHEKAEAMKRALATIEEMNGHNGEVEALEAFEETLTGGLDRGASGEGPPGDAKDVPADAVSEQQEPQQEADAGAERESPTHVQRGRE